jgi:hypothetical protein|tara:strand:+ start:599 stop:742 length:144 start_codon:yes stop_codon:yes gene_type:complete
MKKEKLNEWGYPIHPKSNYLKTERDFETWIGLIIVYALMVLFIIFGT